MNQKRIYFASDFHLGVDANLTSVERERQLIRWLELIRDDALEIYILGDIFDFWFEYKTVVPKGNVRFQAKLAELTDAGIPVHFFAGNHDMWIFDYFEKELGVITHREPMVTTLLGKKFMLGHGDGLGPGDHGYKFIKKVFANPICQWLFERIHPNFGIGLANFWSQKSKDSHMGTDKPKDISHEWLYQYCESEIIRQPDIDFFIFGHRHLSIDYTLSNKKTRYINLGQWLFDNTYAVFDGTTLSIKFFENDGGKTFP